MRRAKAARGIESNAGKRTGLLGPATPCAGPRARTPRSGNLWAIVLAGGEGQRPRVSAQRHGVVTPSKQLGALGGSRTMLQRTWDRIETIVPRELVVTAVDARHASMVRSECGDRADRTLIQEPVHRETAAATLLSLAHVLRADPGGIVGVFPSDHCVLEEKRFMAHVQMGAWAVRRGLWDVIVLGVSSEGPDAHCGWLEVNRSGRHPGSCLLPVGKFWANPEPSIARLLHERGHFWSTMVIVARASQLWELVCEAQPGLRGPFERIKSALHTDAAAREIAAAYQGIPSASLAADVFESQATHLAAIYVRDVQWRALEREERIGAASVPLTEQNGTPSVEARRALNAPDLEDWQSSDGARRAVG
jgi:mannose-1-phosphate guanylyltransferase